MKKVLIASEYSDEARELEAFLSDRDFRTEVTSQWKDIYKRALEMKPDLIILKPTVAGMDGRFICHLLKCSSRTRHIPVFMIAEDSRLSIPEDHGIDLFLSKQNLQNDLTKILG